MKQLFISMVILFGVLAPGVSASSYRGPVITEYMADPAAVSDARGEWIEIYNYNDVELDLSGWSIDGKVLKDDITVAPMSGAVICKNADPTLNGGVVCDTTASFSLSNSGDIVTLSDANGVEVLSGSYEASDIEPGKSRYLWEDGVFNNSSHKYGDGDFGTPINNSQGSLIVNGVTDSNENGLPNLFGAESIESDWKINLYKEGANGWYLRNSVITSGNTFPDTTFFHDEAGDYIVCMVIPDGFTGSFAGSYSHFALNDAQVASPSTENEICTSAQIIENKYSNYIFGAY